MIGTPPGQSPLPGVTYTGLLRREPADFIRPIFALVLVLSGFVLLPGMLMAAIQTAGWLLRGRPDWASYAQACHRFALPEGMLAAHLSLASLIVLVLLALRFVNGLQPRWVWSVQPGPRWRYLLTVAFMALIVVNAMQVVVMGKQLLHPHPQPDFWWFFVIIVLTSPLQAAGEEFLFRGLFLTTLGSLAKNQWVGIVASAVVFSLFHGVQNPALFFDRFAFGLLAGYLVVKTGGLEAAIAIHAVNNVCAFSYAALYKTIEQVRATNEVTWAQMVADITLFALLSALGLWVARLMQCSNKTPATT